MVKYKHIYFLELLGTVDWPNSCVIYESLISVNEDLNSMTS